MKISKERGIAIVEFAVVMPVLLILLNFLLEMGWYYNNKIICSAAIGDGAVYGSRVTDTGTYPTDQEIKTKVTGIISNQLFSFGGITGLAVTVPSGVCTGVGVPDSGVKVAINYKHNFLWIAGLPYIEVNDQTTRFCN